MKHHLVLRLAVLFVFVSSHATHAQSKDVAVSLSQPSTAVPFGLEVDKTGEPYSLIREMSHRATLTDGTHIEDPPETMHMYRDFAGRTRVEIYKRMNFQNDPSAEPELVSVVITDPVAKKRYFLNVRAHTASEADMGRAVVPAPAVAPKASAGTTSVSTAQTQVTAHAQTAEVTRKSLGTEERDGFLVDGMETTRTYATGSVGNDRPISTVRVQWYSQELGIEMLSTYSDPRSGTSVTRVTQIDRTEPDPSLFQVPADYAVTSFPETR